VVEVAGSRGCPWALPCAPDNGERLAERWLQSEGSEGWGVVLWSVADATCGMGRRCSHRCTVRLAGGGGGAGGRAAGASSEGKRRARRPWQEHRHLYRRC